MKRKTALIASTVLALTAAPLLAEGHAVMYDAENTLEGKTADVTTMEAMSGGSVFLTSGMEFGKIEEFSIDNQDRAEIIIDVDPATKFVAERIILTADAKDVTVKDGSIALNASEDTLFAQKSTAGEGNELVRINL